MITEKNGLFQLHTANTTYAFQILPSGQAEHLYYGERMNIRDAKAPADRKVYPVGCGVWYSEEYPTLCLEDLNLEASAPGKGDLREPLAELRFPDGNPVSDFIYSSHEIRDGGLTLRDLPTAYPSEINKGEDAVQTLTVTYQDRNYPVELILTYTVYPDCDVITRSSAIVNHMEEELLIDRLLSLQLDLTGSGYRFTTFRGAWAREMDRVDNVIRCGTYVNQSLSGVSSNRANPFVIVSSPETTEDAGLAIGFHLIYSGNHYEALDVNAYEKTRIVTGIHPRGFRWRLGKEERFETPEAAMSLSMRGFAGMSRSMHAFIRSHIVRGSWKEKERPVLINSWEAAYFDFDEEKLLKLARSAKDAGIELFVMDDGWFGKRNSDTCSLGDWVVNKEKLPGGIEGIAKKIHALGMDFGIWVEPEMVNEDSDLCRAHPDWAVRVPRNRYNTESSVTASGDPEGNSRQIAGEAGYLSQAIGRTQMILDLTRKEVRDCIVEQMSAVFSSAGVNYVKWDMNRYFTDVYSPALPAERQEEFPHRYVLGLYDVMKRLTEAFPDILFEACASGGNRFDPGMLCYMPQIWASDDTDAIERVSIQEGYSYGYPMSVQGAHVSACPNHQTLRITPLDTRFHVAAFGLLGYECDLTACTEQELQEIREQAELYKKWREVFFRGTFYRLGRGRSTRWACVSEDRKRAVFMMVQGKAFPNVFEERVTMKGLLKDTVYRFTNRRPSAEGGAGQETEEYELTGAELMGSGVTLTQGFSGLGGSTGQVRLYPDYASRMYFMEAVDE